MSKTIVAVVKILGMSIIFSLLFAFSVYIVRLKTLDNRVSALKDSIVELVEQQNYLPESAVPYFKAQFEDILNDLGGDSNDNFVVSWSINHSGMPDDNKTAPDSVQAPSMSDITIGKDLANPGAFCSIQVVDIVIEISPPLIGGLTGTTKMHFTGLALCQQYIK